MVVDKYQLIVRRIEHGAPVPEDLFKYTTEVVFYGETITESNRIRSYKMAMEELMRMFLGTFDRKIQDA